MQNGPIVLNIAKPILPAHRTDDVRGDAARRCVTYSHTFNLIYTSTPPLTLHTLSNILHRAAWAVPAVLQSRPRPLRLARSVSSRAFFVAVSNFHPVLVIPATSGVATPIALTTLFFQYYFTLQFLSICYLAGDLEQTIIEGITKWLKN